MPLSYYVVSSHRYEETGDGLKCIGPLGEWKRGKHGRLLIDVTAYEIVVRSGGTAILYIFIRYIYTYMKNNKIIGFHRRIEII